MSGTSEVRNACQTSAKFEMHRKVAEPTNLLGVILAGGLGTRMGGRNKATILLDGQSLLAHVANRLKPMVAAIIISSNEPVEFAELPVIKDDLPGRPGPLAGILSALDWAHDHNYDHVVSAATDTPFFPTDLVNGLRTHANEIGLCLAASVDAMGNENLHPTFGLWPVAMRHPLRAFLESGQRKVRLFTQQHQAGVAVFHGVPDPFFNINTHDDLEIAQQIIRSRHSQNPASD